MHVILTSAGEAERSLHFWPMIPGDFTARSAWPERAELWCCPARHTQIPCQGRGVGGLVCCMKSSCTSTKETPGRGAFPLRKQVWLSGSQDPLPPNLPRFHHRNQLFLPKTSPWRKWGFLLHPGLLNSSGVSVSLEITFYFCPRPEFSVLQIWANFPRNPGQPTEVAHRLLIISFRQKKRFTLRQGIQKHLGQYSSWELGDFPVKE